MWRSVLALAIAAVGACAEDHEVEIRCTEVGVHCIVELSEDPIVLVAGRDRVRWHLPVACDDCPEFKMLPSIGVCVGPYPPVYDCLWLWRTGVTAFRGPFCEPGSMRYWIEGRSSHGGLGFVHEAEIRIEAPQSKPPASDLRLPWIGIFGDSAATTCNLTAQGRGRAWVYVDVGGLGYCALGGAELRIRGFPAAWGASARPNPNAVVETNDLLGAGARLSFPDCQSTESRVLLYTIDYLVQGDVPYAVDIRGSSIAVPTITLCETSGRSEQPVIAGLGIFDPHENCGPVSVHSTPWSRVKQMFR